MKMHRFAGIIALVIITLAAIRAPDVAAVTTAPSTPLPAIAPPLPFEDNPDPTLCGIPAPDGRRATVTGTYAGELVQPIVYLYDSHSRNQVVGQLYPGTRVKVELRQINPLLNFYFVRTIGVEPAQSGWIPAPFLRFDDGRLRASD